MKNLTFLFACILGLFLFSCERSEELGYSENKTYETAESYVYRERDPNSPLILSIPRDRSVVTRAIQLNFDDVLGRSFKVDYFPFENMQNVGAPIIDMERLNADYDWATILPLRESFSSVFSYSTFDRYQTTSTTSKKIYSGFELNFGLFKIGNKSAYYKHFTKTLIESSNSVFGQLDIEVNDAVYKLAVNSNRLKLIRKNYLESDFINDLNNLSPYELFTFYGPFVITNFITGGRATAIFAGISKTMATGETLEKNMDIELASSFTFKKNEDGTVSLGFGKGFTNGQVNTETFTQLDASLTTSGGAYGLGAFTTPSSIDNMNVDLTGWANSLNNSETHAMVDIQDSGLIPLSEFIVEANLKAQYRNYVASGELPSKMIIEPKLVNKFTQLRPAGVFANYMCLVTRFNDVIIIREDIIVPNVQKKKELDAKFDELCNIFRIEAKKEAIPVIDNTTDFPDLQKGIYNSQINIAVCGITSNILKSGISLEHNMKKYHDTNSEMLYLLYNENDKKVGYSIYMGKGDYLLDTYGIRQWVNTLPTTTVTDNELLNYTLIAL